MPNQKAELLPEILTAMKAAGVGCDTWEHDTECLCLQERLSQFIDALRLAATDVIAAGSGDRYAQGIEAAAKAIMDRARRCKGMFSELPEESLQSFAKVVEKDVRALLHVSAAPVCENCNHVEPHDGPAGDINDACTHPGCNCGYDSRPSAPVSTAPEPESAPLDLLTALEHQMLKNHVFDFLSCSECELSYRIATQLRGELGLLTNERAPASPATVPRDCPSSNHPYRVHDWRWLGWPLDDPTSQDATCDYCGADRGRGDQTAHPPTVQGDTESVSERRTRALDRLIEANLESERITADDLNIIVGAQGDTVPGNPADDVPDDYEEGWD